MHPLYQDVCSVLAKSDSRQGTLKRLCLAPNIRNKRATLALASETSRYSEAIEACMKAAGIGDQEREFQAWMLRVLFYEVLVGKGKVQGGGAASRFVKDHAPRVKEEFAKLMRDKGADGPEGLVEARQRELPMPRYARVNTLKLTVPEAVAHLQADGFELVDYAAMVADIGARSRRFALDSTLGDVLLFAHGTDLHAHPMVLSSELRLQDKASCFPAHVLAAGAQPIRVALDACSAPGNKTTHLSALMGGEGKVIAVEMDKNRRQLLGRTVEIMGAGNVQIVGADFLTLPRHKKPYCEVEGILLDPSCSGSGIVGRSARDADGDPEQARQRLQRLCEFQTKALNHALGFPGVRRVVYSTCSVHREENEDVVAACLERHRDTFELEEALPSWQRRGLPLFDSAHKCIRVKHEDLAQGFFVACFVRKAGASRPSGDGATKAAAAALAAPPGAGEAAGARTGDGAAARLGGGKIGLGMRLASRAFLFGGGSRGLSLAVMKARMAGRARRFRASTRA